MIEIAQLLTMAMLGIWLNIAVRLIGYLILKREWRKGLANVDHDTCMCGSTGGSCVWEMSHQFMSTRDYWDKYKPEYD